MSAPCSQAIARLAFAAGGFALFLLDTADGLLDPLPALGATGH